MVGSLGAKRGVLAAWPAIAGMSARASERIVALSQVVVSGYAWWWLWHLKRTVFSHKDSYGPSGSDSLVVYRLGGEPSRSFDWFPSGSIYNIAPGAIDGFLHFGLTLSVREFRVGGREPTLQAQEQQAAAAAYLQLDAATNSIGPAVFATHRRIRNRAPGKWLTHR